LVFATELDADVQPAVIEWLRAQAESQEGYAEYMAVHNKPLHNPNVVRHWDFVAKFFALYRKASSTVHAQVCPQFFPFNHPNFY
jgi:hypothetical protein